MAVDQTMTFWNSKIFNPLTLFSISPWIIMKMMVPNCASRDCLFVRWEEKKLKSLTVSFVCALRRNCTFWLLLCLQPLFCTNHHLFIWLQLDLHRNALGNKNMHTLCARRWLISLYSHWSFYYATPICFGCYIKHSRCNFWWSLTEKGAVSLRGSWKGYWILIAVHNVMPHWGASQRSNRALAYQCSCSWPWAPQSIYLAAALPKRRMCRKNPSC